MADLIKTKEETERVILIGVALSEKDDTESSLSELSDLCATAGALAVGTVIQSRERPDAGTYIGKGKIEEVRMLLAERQAGGIVTDDELSPAQMKNLREALEVKVMDRTMVILDIFARHAVTDEGKIQVELAQLKYSAAHLEGLRASLSRLGGGIGTRGPGEKKIEMDRRVIHERIGRLKEDLEDVRKHREVARKSRERSHAFVAAIVGYTNAGKSTLLNCLTNAGVSAEDMLFATLDPVTRRLKLSGGQEILLTDTVGFIRKLPHNLIDAFRSTLEEAKYADLILHVVDAADPEADLKMLVVYDTLRDLGVTDKEIVTVFNKTDRAEQTVLRDFHADRTVRISARTGSGTDELKQILEEILRSRKVCIEKLIPYSQAGLIQEIRKYGELLSEEYTDGGIAVRANVPAEMAGRLNRSV